MHIGVEEKDWPILAGMGSGAEKGCEAANVDTWEKAHAACRHIEQCFGIVYDIDRRLFFNHDRRHPFLLLLLLLLLLPGALSGDVIGGVIGDMETAAWGLQPGSCGVEPAA